RCTATTTAATAGVNGSTAAATSAATHAIRTCASAGIATAARVLAAGLPGIGAGIAERLIARGPAADIAIAAGVGAAEIRTVAAAGAAARLQHLLAAGAAEVQLVAAAADIIAAELGRDAGVVVTDIAAMRRIMRPVVAAEIVDVDRAVGDDVVVAPVEAAAPAIAARGPAPERIAGAERQPGRENSDADIGRRRPVIGRIIRIVPRPVDHGRIVIRHIDLIGVGRGDIDVLPAARALRGHGLLAGRLQLVVGLRLYAQALDRIHDVRLLR